VRKQILPKRGIGFVIFAGSLRRVLKRGCNSLAALYTSPPYFSMSL
jgi:hypothetical protein